MRLISSCPADGTGRSRRCGQKFRPEMLLDLPVQFPPYVGNAFLPFASAQGGVLFHDQEEPMLEVMMINAFLKLTVRP